jgi:uncharacterized protein with beta-barrel porin domain
VGTILRSGSSGRRSVSVAARSIATGLVIALLTGESAWADCTPASANNVTATCTGITTNQGGGAPGTSLGFYGYGTGTETGVTVNVGINASVTGSGADAGIFLGDATVTNNAGGSVSGDSYGIKTTTGFANVTNSGSIGGILFAGIYAQTNATVTNNAGANINGALFGIRAFTGFIDVANSGGIQGMAEAGIAAQTNATVINNAGASINGAQYGVSSSFANVTNSGSIAGTFSAGIYAQTNATVTNNAGALISSSQYAILANAGGSSVFNAGTLSGGAAAIFFSGSGNTLTLGPGSVISGNVLGTGSDTFQLGGTGAATFDVSTLGSQYQGFAILNKIGSSVWTLTGTSNYAGPVNVDGGTLNVNGNIASASGVTVNAGGTLGGNGTIGNTAINAGSTFAPGNGTPGSSMAITGNLALQSGAVYAVQINPATSSLANVTGTATLGGSTVNTTYVAGSYISKQYTILTAGSVSGMFGSLSNTNLPSNFTDTLSYDANDVYLNLKLAFGIPGNLNGNQQAVGNALINFFNTTGGIPASYALLSASPFSQASGELATGSQQTTFDAMSLFMGLLTDPFMNRTEAARSTPGAIGYADEALGYAASQRDAFAMFTKAPPAPFVQRWSVWAAGFGGSQSTGGNAAVGSNNTTSSIAATAVGADYLFSPNTIAGFALAGGGTNFSVNGLGSGRSDLFQAGAYVRHTEGPAYISAALAYGWQDITTNRTLTIAGVDQLRAEFDANAYSGRIEGGYRFVAPWTGGVGITPYAAGQFTTFDLPAYAESVVTGTSNFALAYAAKDVTNTRSELGIRADKSFIVEDGVLTLRGRLAWAHDYDPDRSIAATFQTLPGASFVVNGAAQAYDSALTTASVEMKWINGWSAAATFEGEFSDVTSSYAGKGVVRYVW